MVKRRILAIRDCGSFQSGFQTFSSWTHCHIHHTSYITHHRSYIIHHTSYIIHHTSYIIHHTPYIIRHTPYIIHHTSYIHTYIHTYTYTHADVFIPLYTSSTYGSHQPCLSTCSPRSTMYDVWCITYDVLCTMYYVWCMMYYVWCMMYDVWYTLGRSRAEYMRICNTVHCCLLIFWSASCFWRIYLLLCVCVCVCVWMYVWCTKHDVWYVTICDVWMHDMW